MIYGDVQFFLLFAQDVVIAVQDANECWTEVVRCLQRKVPALSSPPAVSSTLCGYCDEKEFKYKRE